MVAPASRFGITLHDLIFGKIYESLLSCTIWHNLRLISYDDDNTYLVSVAHESTNKQERNNKLVSRQ
jgi:hypothetical protein